MLCHTIKNDNNIMRALEFHDAVRIGGSCSFKMCTQNVVIQTVGPKFTSTDVVLIIDNCDQILLLLSLI